MVWTSFMDMHSGGGQKLEWTHIWIEAPQEEAAVIFQNRFGRNPSRVTCTCCGEDYSIDESPNLRLATAFERGCRALETPRDPETGRYKEPDDPAFHEHYYLEKGEDPPPGYSVGRSYGLQDSYQTLDEYMQRKGVLFIAAHEIRPEERVGELREEGYVWQD